MNVLNRVWSWLTELLGRKNGIEKKSATPKKRAKKQSTDHYGAHYYLGDLLDRLDSVFEAFPAFRKGDPEAFELYRKIGAAVTSSDALTSREMAAHFTADNLPSFGCVGLGMSKETSKGRVNASFAYFVKEARPINVQPSNKTVYRVGLVFSEKEMPPACMYFYVSLADDGTVTPLKVLSSRNHALPFKQNRNCYSGPRVVKRMEWGLPEALKDIASDNNETPQDIAQSLFTIVANQASMSEAGITVRAKKGVNVATFAVDMLRTPYFFSDRKKVVNHNGRTKPILHIVRAHKRTLAGGRHKVVKTHFRGLRKFEWNGYQVSIGLGGKHHIQLSDFDVAARPEVEFEDLKNAVTLGGVGDRLSNAMEAAQ